MHKEWPIQRLFRRHPNAGDALLAIVVAVSVIAAPDDSHRAPANMSIATLLFTLFACLSLAARRRFPLAVLAATTIGTVLATTFADERNAASLSCAIALYTVATHKHRRIAEAAGVTASVMVVTTSYFAPRFDWRADGLGTVALFAAAVAIGEAVASRRAYIAATEERAIRAEHTQKAEARRQVVEERLRIARELHDVVAHHIAIISAQAGAASQLLTSNPNGAAEALIHVRKASRSVLEELAGMLHLLRQADDVNTSNPAVPAVGINDLSSLLQSFAATGLVTTTSIRTPPFEMPLTVGLVTYRIVQEALTNAHKHGDGRATLDMHYHDGALQIHVFNSLSPSPPPSPSSGQSTQASCYGITGMHERAVAVHGTLQATLEDDGRFHVRASLPLELPLEMEK